MHAGMRDSDVEGMCDSDVEDRWFAIGHSSEADARLAGWAAADAALGERSDGKLLVVFCSDGHALDELLEAINERSGGVPLVGCSTAGEISSAGARDASVVVTALGGPGIEARTASVAGVGDRLRNAGAALTERLAKDLDEERPHQALLLLTDGLAGDQEEIVRGAYEIVGASVPLVGGCAGDGLKMAKTLQLHDDRVLENGIVGAWIASSAPLGIGVRHGWRRVGEPMLVTASEGTRVDELDDRPALDVYLERLEAPPEAHRDPSAFTQFALTHPLGLYRRSGEEVRFIGEADFESRSLVSIANVPQGGLAWIMEGDAESVLDATDAAVEAALEPLDSAPLGLLVFDCIARRGVLGDEGITREVRRVSERGGAPVAGFYTYGEIARTRGVNGFHNETLVVLAVS